MTNDDASDAVVVIPPRGGSKRVLPAANIRADHASEIDLPDASVDFAFTCGVLIHVHPDELLSFLPRNSQGIESLYCLR